MVSVHFGFYKSVWLVYQISAIKQTHENHSGCPYILSFFFLFCSSSAAYTPFPGDAVRGPLISVNNSIWQAAANSFHVLMINQTGLFTNVSECIRNIR